MPCKCERPDCDLPPEVRGLSRTCYYRLHNAGKLELYAAPRSPRTRRPARSAQVRLADDLVQALEERGDGDTLTEQVDRALRSALGVDHA